MGNRRVVLFGVALAALFSIDAAAAASKGASRTSNRRSVVEHGGRPSRTYRYRDEEGAQEHDGLKDGGKIGSKRTKSNRGKDRSSSGSSRLSPRSSSSRSSSRLILAVVTRRTDGRGMEVVPSKRSSTKNSMLAGLATTVKGKATSLREDARGKMTEWKNIAKTTVWFSSKMEKFMIQMTWPDDGLLDDVWVKDTMKFLENAGNEPPRSPNNPNKRILRKLWLRMTEEDYRTKLKALQILHHASMDLSPEAHLRVRSQFMKMRDETNHKNRNEVYFESSRIAHVSSSGIPFLPLLRSYSSYTFRRIIDVPGGSKQVASILRSKKTPQAEAVSVLRRLEKLICMGVGCKVDRKTLNTVTGQVLQLSARDLMILWRLYVKGLTKLMKGGYKEGKAASPEAVVQLLRQYTKTQEVLEKYLRHFKRVVRDRSMFEDNQVDPAALEEALEACLTSVPPPRGTTATGEEDFDEESDVRGEEEEENEE
ncbi:unnamed protein product [Ascophyllum nodosum]